MLSHPESILLILVFPFHYRWPLELPLDHNGGSVLVPLLHQSLKHMSDNILANSRLTSYLVDASIDVSYLKAPLNTVNDVAAQTKITLGTSALASLWASTLIYCCIESCDTFASALGNALAYADKVSPCFLSDSLCLITLLLTGRGRFRSAGDCCEILSLFIIVDEIDMRLN